MATQIERIETYRVNTETDVKAFIEEVKKASFEEGYTLKSYSSTLKEKKAKGEVIDEGYLVKISKVYNNFWEV